MVLAPREVKTASFKFRTRIIDSIFDDDKYTTKKVSLSSLKKKEKWLWLWLVGFYGISTFVGYLTPNPFYAISQLYFKQFSLTWVHSFIVKTVRIQLIQFCISNTFVYT